jgi:L-lactate utilization protein LutB
MEMVYRNIRFSEKVDRCLRRRWRMHGDLSSHVREALRKIDLAAVELVDVDNNRAKATQIGNIETAWECVQSVARTRNCSVNTLVNSAVWAAYGARKAVLSELVRGPDDNDGAIAGACLGEA